MKKLLIICLTFFTLSSCSEDEPNCDCDRVVSTNYSHFGMPGGGSFSSGSFNTVNECTNETRTWSAQTYGFPRIGECK